MKSHVIDGTRIAQQILAQLKQGIKDQHLELGLAAVCIGGSPELKFFIELKKKAAQEIGIQFSSYELNVDASMDTVRDTMDWLARDNEIHGVLVELPIPEKFSSQEILDLVSTSKDVDVLTSSREKEFYDRGGKILPPAVRALSIVFDSYDIDPKGKTIAVFGQGRLVGKPISYWLKKQGAKVIAIDEYKKNPGLQSREADIIISGVGKPGLIKADMVKDDAIVIDYGYPIQSNSAVHHPPVGGKGRTLYGTSGQKGYGDVDFENVAKKASFITPVPGGMGPLVIAAMLENLVRMGSK